SPLRGFDPWEATIKDKLTGKIYDWNSRAHRKLRHPFRTDGDDRKDHKANECPKIWCFEPNIVTWHLNQCNQSANTFWVLGSVFTFFPTGVDEETTAKIVYASNTIAGFLLIASCYLAYVEAINHTHSDIRLCDDKGKNETKSSRIFRAAHRVYGLFRSPLGYNNHGLDSPRVRTRLLRMGYPVVESFNTEELISLDIMNEAISGSTKTENTNGDEDEEAPEDQATNDDQNNPLIGQHVNIRSQEYVVRTRIEGICKVPLTRSPKRSSYIWWTWQPALNQVGVLCALIGFVSSLVYFIPMVLVYPLAQSEASTGVTVFFVDVLQVIPYTLFVITGHIYMAEAAGSWCKPRLNSIGYYIALFNTLGAYGFLLCGALAIPEAVGLGCCPNMGRWGGAFACFWGSCCYWIGGFLQFIEFSNPDGV
ncbi:MAG: hypothetical protein SGILL_001991, partial [Bacillariaceae sp.]